jgi:hypothetical protein
MPHESVGDMEMEMAVVDELFKGDIDGTIHQAALPTGVETLFEPLEPRKRHNKPTPPSIEIKPVVIEDFKETGQTTETGSPPTAEDKKKRRIPFKQIFLPKLRLLKILLKVDPLAAWVVCLSVISNGLMKTWSLACQYRAMTAFQEAILTRNIDSRTIIPLLIQQFVVEFCLQMAIYSGIYGHKRYKKRMEKHLTELLLEAYGALPYTTRIDRYISKRYNAVLSLVEMTEHRQRLFLDEQPVDCADLLPS